MFYSYKSFTIMRSNLGISELTNGFGLIHQIQVVNEIKIVVVQDPSAAKSSCAVSIDVGSALQPESAPGLAHLLQHMLFMGSQSYPTSNQYSHFLSSHGGYENAQTCDFYTNYYCQISTPYFQQAVLRTVDAFTRPLLPIQCIASQIQAVHEEYALAGNDDDSRVEEIVKLFMKPPLNRFAMGNRESLEKINIRQLLVDFHKDYYSNANISVVLYSSMSFQQIKDRLFPHIATLRKQMIPTLNEICPWTQLFKFEAFKQQKQNKLVLVKSISNEDTLKIHMPINLSQNTQIQAYFGLLPPSEKQPCLQSLTQFIHQFYTCLSYIITHPSANSLSEYLSEQQISTDATIQIVPVVPFTQFMIVITIDVAEEWVNKLSEVQHKVMQHLRHYVKIENMQGVMKQVLYLSKLWSENYEVEDMQDFVCDTARDIYEFGLDKAIDYKNMSVDRISEMEDVTKWCIDVLLNANNKIIVFSSPQELKGNSRKEPYLGTQYLLPQHKQWKTNSQNTFSYPTTNLPPNPFIPLSGTISPPTNVPYTPIKIGSNIYFSSAFSNIAKGGIKLVLHNRENYVFNLLFTQFMDLYLEDIQDIKFAEQVGLDYYFHFHQGDLFLYIFGFNQLVIKVLAAIGQMLGKFCVEVANGNFKKSETISEIFEESIQNLEEDLDNYYQQDMDDLTDKIRDQLLLQNSLPLHLITKQLSKIKKNKFLERAADLLTQSITQWIVVGNFNPQQTELIIKQFEDKIPNRKSTVQTQQNQQNQQSRVVKQTKVMNLSNLGKGKKIKLEQRLQSQIQTSTCLSYFEAGLYSEQLFWILEILYMYLDESFYNHVRMFKKLSYDLEVNIVNTRGILGICFLLVSSKIDPELISKEIQEFSNLYISQTALQSHLGQSLSKIKQAVVVKFSEKFATVEDCFDFIADEITDRTFYFNKKNKQEIEQQLSKISSNIVVETAIKIFSGASLQIFLVSKAHKNSYSNHRPKVSSLQSIKSNAEYYKDLLADLDFRFGDQK